MRNIFFQLQAVRNQCFGRRGDRPEAKNVAIIITDGVPFPEDRYEPAITEAEKLRKEDGIFLYSYGIRDMNFLANRTKLDLFVCL